jgi:hypothetical protein
MQLNDITSTAFNTLFGRLLRRALGAALLTAFAIVALYYASGAGTLVLNDKFGMLYAYLIMTAIYAAAALSFFIVLWASRTKPIVTEMPDGALASPRNMQIAMLIEAVMLGYSMARKTRIP